MKLMKRIMAFALALALVFSLVPGVKSKAAAAAISTALVVGNYREVVVPIGTAATLINEKQAAFDAQVAVISSENGGATFNGTFNYSTYFVAESDPIPSYQYIEIVGTGTDEYSGEIILNCIAVGVTEADFIEAVDVTVTLPEVGSNVTFDWDEGIQTPKATATASSTSNCSVFVEAIITNYPSVLPTGYDDPFEGTINAGEYYFVELFLSPNEGYKFSADTVIKVNGGNSYEINENYIDYPDGKLMYVKVKAGASATYTVKFETGEGSKIDLQEVEGGSTATKPSANPTRTGYTFGGWYADEDWKTEFDFSKAITADTTVYAKWTAEEKKPTYTILDGANQTLETEAGKDLVVRASGEVSKFTGLKIDGKEVEKSNYTITEGSTIATIKAALLDTLDEGEHTLTFVYTDGEVSTSFTMKKHTTPVTVTTTPAEVTTPATTEAAAKKTNAASPKTGDSLPVIPLAVLMITSLAGALLLKKKRTNI